MATYTTKQGDMWDSIAYAQLGSTDYTDELIQSNLQYAGVYEFTAGVILELPVITVTPDTTNLPVWKGGTSGSSTDNTETITAILAGTIDSMRSYADSASESAKIAQNAVTEIGSIGFYIDDAGNLIKTQG